MRLSGSIAITCLC